MNSKKKSKTSKPHLLILNFTDKLDLRRGENRIWNDKFELPDRSYSAWDIQDYFEYLLKKHGENIDNPSIKIYV